MSGRAFHVTVIAKEPIPGLVKTRLVPPLTHRQAADVARACLVDTFAAVTATVATLDDAVAVALIHGRPGDWIPSGYRVIEQRGDGLGDRLRNGFDELGPGLVIGMDTPSAGPLLADAIASIRAGRDAVGLTFDGGYWGIALADPDGREFDGVPMSTSRTGQAQVDRLLDLGRDVDVLSTVHDLDHHDDIATIVELLPGSELERVAASL